jgi:hypothetical protein
MFGKAHMAIHSRKPFKAGEPIEFTFTNGNMILVSPAGGDIHGAFLEAVEVLPSTDSGEERYRTAQVILDPKQIIAFFTATIPMTGYNERQLRDLAFDSGLVADAEDAQARLKSSGGVAHMRIDPPLPPKDRTCRIGDTYGDVLTSKPRKGTPGLVDFTFTTDGEDITLTIPPDMLVALFTSCCRSVNYTPEEMREMAIRADMSRPVSVPNRKEKRRRERARKAAHAGGSRYNLSSLNLPSEAGSKGKSGSSFFR